LGDGKIYLYFYLVTILRIILFPVSLLYGFVTFIRNKLFDWNVFQPVIFPIKVLAVGNLSVGGTGKTPHIEYLLQLLKDNFRVATLSRGYKRKSKGFILAGESSDAEILGDEAYQYKLRYPGVAVAVDEDRVHGIRKLQENIQDLEVVLLDDAFQHRWVKPGLSILLTDFYHLYPNDYMLPTGNLREYRSGAKRADLIVVTKTPRVLSPITRQRILNELKPDERQPVFFSYIEHGPLHQIPGVEFIPKGDFGDQTALLFAGIANPYPLESYLKKQFARLEHIYFRDHHMYTEKDIMHVIRTFDKIFSKNKVVVTTEKDMVRLLQPELLDMIRHLPFCYVPIQVKFHDNDKDLFDKKISYYVKDH